eukprot:m.120925 g.120925  ORF g.120925 m.120925 type:complete len:376 (-) comp12918_c0_seq3:2227-3354(-)
MTSTTTRTTTDGAGGSKGRVMFLHPDLGIGGAERLVVDAALALKSKGYSVCIATSHHDKERCFEETKNGAVDVLVYGSWLPRTLFGRFYAVCAYVRMLYLAFFALLFRRSTNYVFVDQISACIPIVKTISSAKVLFYCHFPDQLLTQRESFWKGLYRKPIDKLEEATTGMADVLMVNSNFTRKIYFETFHSLRNTQPHIVYPSLNFESFDRVSYDEEDANQLVASERPMIFLSINRFERKKNLLLAIEALASLKGNLLENGKDSVWECIHLVVAGGYDVRLPENVEYFEELSEAATSLGVTDHITFIRSFSDKDKVFLFVLVCVCVYFHMLEHVCAFVCLCVCLIIVYVLMMIEFWTLDTLILICCYVVHHYVVL